MKPILGLNTNFNPADLPEGFYNFAKNIVLTDTDGVVTNEDGFLYSAINSGVYGNYIAQGYSPVGTIVTKIHTVVFLTNNINSVIGLYYEDQDNFVVLFDDTTKSFKLNLNKDFPIKGEWFENFLAEIIIAWTDNNVKPKVLNLSKVSTINEEKDVLLFSEFLQPLFSFNIEKGGQLKSGTYVIYIQYENNNGAKTDWSIGSNPIYITLSDNKNAYYDFKGSATGVNTLKQINLVINNVDISYNKINIALKKKISGDNSIVFKQILQKDITTSTLNVLINGGETETVLTPNEVLVKNPLYTKAKAITQLDSRLFLGNLKADSDINLQPYFNTCSLKFVYEEVTAANSKLPRYSKERSFAHNEVYAIYGVGITTEGKYTQAFHIPGRASRLITVGGKTFNENATIKTVDNLPTEVGTTTGTAYLAEDTELASNVKYFQTRDTCSWDVTNQEGDLGYWQNENENYPLTDDWGTLQGTPVRHHRFPSFKFTKDNLYSTDNQYNITKLDRLGVKIKDLVIPDNIKNRLQFITLFYAKRTYNNSTVISNEQSIFCGFERVVSSIGGGSSTANDWGTLPFWSPIAIGNNFETVGEAGGDFIKKQFSVKYQSNYGGTNTLAANAHFGDVVDTNNYFILKAQSPDLVTNKPDLTGTYIRPCLKYTTAPQSVYLNESTNAPSDVVAGQVVYINDFIANTTFKQIRSLPESNSLVIIQKYDYLVGNLSQPLPSIGAGQILNYSEEGVAIKIKKFVNIVFNSVETNSDIDIHISTFGKQNSFLNVGEIKSNPNISSGLDFLAGVPLSSRNGVDEIPNTNAPYHSGYLYTILKYKNSCYTDFINQDLISTGTLLPLNNLSQSIYNADCFLDISFNKSFTTFISPAPGEYPVNVGYKFITQYNFLTESVKNVGLRSFAYIPSLGETSNDYSINSDYNTINEEESIVTFKSIDSFTSTFPHRIIQSLPVTTESKIVQWRTFLPANYYEINKSKGQIINLQYYKDQLLIHTERALYYTRDNQQLDTSGGTVQIGNGDIFEFPPFEVLPTKEGYTGTQHMFSCQLYKNGYFWIDAEQGKAFLFSTNLEEISVKGLTNFFKNNLGKFEDKSFSQNGITVAWDNNYRRLLVGVKNNTNNLDKSHTLSFASEINRTKSDSGGWASFHDYIPDHLFNTRKNVFSFNNGLLYRHNNPLLKGTYYNNIKYPSFVDTVFNNPKNLNLNAIQWYTQYINQDKTTDFYKTITDVSVWNQYQHSGKVTLTNDQLTIANNYNSRNVESDWYFNSFRDQVNNKSLPFLNDIFNNFTPVNLSTNKVWYEQMLLNNKWFIVRLEFNNETNATIQLYNVEVNPSISYR